MLPTSQEMQELADRELAQQIARDDALDFGSQQETPGSINFMFGICSS